MSCLPRLGGVVLILAMFEARAHAETIRVTGVLTGEDGIVTAHLRSRARQFSLDGLGATLANAWSLDCRGDCLPGERGSLRAVLSGGDFGGTVSIDGQSYRFGSQSTAAGEAFLHFDGTWTIPQFTGRTRATVVRPFTFDGRFFYPIVIGQPTPFETLEGSGRATVRLFWSPVSSGWVLENARYQFTGSPAPVPEPGTMILIATGLAAVASRRRRGVVKAGTLN
jgi:hypothetical protein